MSKLTKIKKKSKKKYWQKIQKSSRKKHVETMFQTNKQKNYPYYFKYPDVTKLFELNPNKYVPKRHIFYIKCLKAGYLTIDPLKAIIRLFKFYVKNLKLEDIFKYKLFTFPDFVLTSKPKEVRMGKGKGSNYKKVSIIKKGQYILSLTCNLPSYQNVALYMLSKMISKLPFNSVILRNNW